MHALTQSMDDKNLVNFGPVTPEFCRRICTGRVTRWALPRISGLSVDSHQTVEVKRFVSADIAILVMKSDVKLQLTTSKDKLRSPKTANAV